MTTEPQTITKFIYKDFSELVHSEESEQIAEEEGDSTSEAERQYAELFGNVEDVELVPRDHLQNEEEPDIQIDIEQIKKDFYQEGYQKAKEELEPLICAKELEDELRKKIIAQLDVLNLTEELRNNISQEVADVIKTILAQLNKLIPTNFDHLFQENFLPIIQNGILVGDVEIKMHPSKKESIAKIIVEHVKDSNISKIRLLEDDNLSTDDIKIEYANGTFQHKSDEIFAAIDKIISNNLNSG
jgi:flagellar biosynthesis/type III secretory pathway protein FliH